MIRRPLNERFADAVLEGRKITTIRDNPWPIGKPIMLFSWSGKPYRSKQVEIAPVIVERVERVWIYHNILGFVRYSHDKLWVTEGFKSSVDMDEWFRGVVKRGDYAVKSLMRFELLERGEA